MMGDRNYPATTAVELAAVVPEELSSTLSATLDSSRSASNISRSYVDISRIELDKRQLLHTVQLLKLELSQKQLLLDTNRNERTSEVEELQEQLSDAVHEKKLAQLRLQAVTRNYEQELKEVRQLLESERVQMDRGPAGFTDTDTIVAEVRRELEEVLNSLSLLSQDQHKNLHSEDLSSLAIGDYVRLRFFELARPLQKHSDNLQRRIALLKQQMSETQTELVASNNSLEEERGRQRKLEDKCSSLTMELSSVKTHIQEGNYKIDNFSTVKRERDTLKSETERLNSSLSELSRREGHIKEELDKVTKELSSVKQSSQLLLHDKDYLSKQTADMSARSATLEDRLEHVSDELVTVKQEKDRLMQEFMNNREEERLMFNHKLQTELDGLHQKTTLEMERLKLQTKEMYDRESKVLSEARDAAIAERDRAITAEKDMSDKYETLLKEHHSFQGVSGRRLAEVQGDLQLLRYDKDRMSLIHDELVNDHRQLQLDHEKLQKKVELMTEEVWCVRREGEMQVKTLESQLLESRRQLEEYYKMEKELEDIVMQSAQLDHSCDAEQVLYTYGFGASIPTSSKRRLQQSVQLARRVLQLERVNSGVRDELRWEGERVSRLQEELESCRELLQCSQQPGTFLMDRLKDLQQKLQHNNEVVKKMEEKIAALRQENNELKDTKNKMSVDLERLLSHREELQRMRVWLTQDGSRGTRVMDVAVSDSRSIPAHHQHPRTSPSHQPRPTVFTKQPCPSNSTSLPHHPPKKNSPLSDDL